MTSKADWVSVEELESKIDYAHRGSLKPYDDEKRHWISITDEELGLAQVAHAALYNTDLFACWVVQHKVEVHFSLKTIAGEDFYCIYFDDAYFVKLWQE